MIYFFNLFAFCISFLGSRGSLLCDYWNWQSKNAYLRYRLLQEYLEIWSANLNWDCSEDRSLPKWRIDHRWGSITLFRYQPYQYLPDSHANSYSVSSYSQFQDCSLTIWRSLEACLFSDLHQSFSLGDHHYLLRCSSAFVITKSFDLLLERSKLLECSYYRCNFVVISTFFRRVNESLELHQSENWRE